MRQRGSERLPHLDYHWVRAGVQDVEDGVLRVAAEWAGEVGVPINAHVGGGGECIPLRVLPLGGRGRGVGIDWDAALPDAFPDRLAGDLRDTYRGVRDEGDEDPASKLRDSWFRCQYLGGSRL